MEAVELAVSQKGSWRKIDDYTHDPGSARAIAWHRGLGYIQSHLCKAHQTNFGHGFAAVPPELPAA